MAEREKLVRALQNASRAADAGDKQAAQDAKRLANALKQMGDQSPQPEQRGAFDRFARGFGGGLTDLAGIVPGAAMELGNLTGVTDFENTSGSDFLKRQLEPLGLTGKPGEDLGVIGRVGEATSQFGLPGVAGSAALARRGATGAVDASRNIGLLRNVNQGGQVARTGAARAPAAKTGTRILDDMAAGAARAPVATGSAELSAAAGESLGRDASTGAFGEGWESDVGGMIGGIIGGLGPTGVASGARAASGAADALPVVGMVKRATGRLFRGAAEGTAGKVYKGITGRTPKVRQNPAARRRASDRLRGVAEMPDDPNAALPAQTNLRQPGGDIDASLLTPAQQSDDPGIMSLAARDRAEDPAKLANWRVQVENNMEVLRQQLKGVTGDEAERIQREYGQNVDDMVVVAAANAERRLANMTPNQRRSDASKVLRSELDKAYRTARAEESELWDMIPDDMVMPAEAVRQRYRQLQGQLSQENIEDMPRKAAQFLDPDSPQSYFKLGDDGELVTETVPLKRLQKLRSALLNEARNASSGDNPNRNRARLARELADGLLDDMANVDPRESPGTGAFLTAKNFSRHLNDRFTRGPVGDVLQTKARGDASIAPEATLDRTIGRGGVEAERASKAFIKAFESPNEDVRGAFTDFLKDDFQRRAIRDGEFNPAGARAFMARYKDLLDTQPALRQQFEQALQDGDLTRVAGAVQDGAARVLGKNNPAAEIRRIRNMADNDPTGAVWASFRKGLTQEVFERARVRNPRGDIDNEIISGSALLEMLDGEKMGPALKQAFNKTELANLRRVANTAQRIERDIGARAAADLVTDEPNALTTLLAGYTGAIGGAKASTAAGGGTAGLRTAQLLSQAMQRMVRKGVRDPAADIIKEALGNKKVMEDLLAPASKPGYETRVVPRINAWLVGLIDEMEAAEDNLEPAPTQRRPREIGRRPGPPIQ